MADYSDWRDDIRREERRIAAAKLEAEQRRIRGFNDLIRFLNDNPEAVGMLRRALLVDPALTSTTSDVVE